MKRLLVLAGILAAAASLSFAGETVLKQVQTLTTPEGKYCYALGMQMGAYLKTMGENADRDAFIQGVLDSLDGGATLLAQAEAVEARKSPPHRAQQGADAKAEDQKLSTPAAKRREAEDAFIEANKTKPGVVTTPSGLQYKVEKQGEGPKPKLTDKVKVIYNILRFDSIEESAAKPGKEYVFAVERVVPGWKEGLQLMNVGSKYRLFLPSDLAYGNGIMIFDVELLGLETGDAGNAAAEKRPAATSADARKQQEAAFLETNKTQPGVITTASGLQYKVEKQGKGPRPGPTDKVTVHYRMTTIDGREGDSSYKRGKPSTFAVNKVIKGWTEALQLMNVGSKFKLFVPAELAYGNSVLLFDVELLGIEKGEPAPEATQPADNAKKPEADPKAAEKNRVEEKEFLELNKEMPNVVETASGLQYEILREGNGPTPKLTDKVKVHYRGSFIDMTEFESTYKLGRPAVFPVDKLIKGWTEGLQLMKAGSKYRFYIPSKLAYGEKGAGPVGPNQVTIFDIELMAIEK